MKCKVNGINLVVVKNYEEMSKIAASLVISEVILKPNCILGLATGGTPVGMYEQIVKHYNEEKLDFSEVRSFNLDEYYPISRTNSQSYYTYMNENLFKHINIKPENISIPNGETKDPEAECKAYDEKIATSNGVDLQILGIGNNGHIGFNEPDLHFESGTHVVELDENTIEANARFFDSIDEVPRKAISMGIKTIMHAKKIVLLANGKNKAEIIEKTILGDITPNVPASILQLHNDVTIIVDEEAAASILAKIK